MKKRLMIIGVAVAALSLVAAGCGDDDDDASAGGDSCEMGDLALKQDASSRLPQASRCFRRG